MGFTVEDMLVVSQKRYQMKVAAGLGGWSNSISWLLLLEDTIITKNFSGKEMAVTTGLGFQSAEKLMELLEDLWKHHASGLIINTGHYIRTIPQQAIDWCNENDFPLLTVPWDVVLAEMIKDLSVRIFLQGTADEQISSALIHAIETPDARELYVKELLAYFDVDGTFQVMLCSRPGLDKMDTVDRRRTAYRIQLCLSNLTHNANFFYYDSVFAVVINDVTDAQLREIAETFARNLNKRMPHNGMTIGIGSQVNDISNLQTAYRRARAALSIAFDQQKQLVYFDDCGIERLLYSVSDTQLLLDMYSSLLKPLIDYDAKHEGNYTETLEIYLRTGGSISQTAEALFTHRNTILYRMNNIRKLLNCPLETVEQRMPYHIACQIRHMGITVKD